jgi:hypothetical protein
MPTLILLSFLAQLALTAHAINTDFDAQWVLAMLLFPLLWIFAYAAMEFLPVLIEIRTGTAPATGSGSKNLVNPRAALREAEDHYATAGTGESALKLAEQYVQHGRFTEARLLYQLGASTLCGDDPGLLLRLARAHFWFRDYQAALDCLDRLKQKYPEGTSAEGHLLYAKCLQEAGRGAEAIHEFKALATYYPGPEAACRLGLLYKRNGDLRKAYEIFENILARSKRANAHYHSLHGEWLTIARNELHKWAPARS